MEYSDKTIIVTGANRGIGEAIAKHFFYKGANVVFAVRDVASVSLPKEILESKRSLLVATDVTDEPAIKNMVKRTVDTFGAIDILVNNAGVDEPCSLLDITARHLDYVWDVNVKGLILCSKYVATEMVKRKQGMIINMSSIAGKEGTLYHTAYTSSKHAVIGVTKCIARELIPFGITVNTVCPGLINTDMLQNFFKEYAELKGTTAEEELEHMIRQTPRGKMGNPEDVAELVGFLCSDRAANIVGTSVNTDGGLLQQ